MKKNLILLAFGLLMTAAIAVLITIAVKQTKEIGRLRDNFNTEITGQYEIQQEVTKRELKRLFSEQLVTLKEYGIKAGQIENIVNVEYRYVDTMRYRDTLVWVYDTVIQANRTPFEIDGECYSIAGEICGDTLEISCYQANDEILLSLYKEKRKCLFEKRKVKAIAVSACKGDTLAILRNLKVVKR